MDCLFPHITYKDNDHHANGLYHGEEYRKPIKQLAQIRKDLMLQKNPSLKDKLDELAQLQYFETQKLSRHLGDEFDGLLKGADLEVTDLVILNNYTDFRDIQLADEGCTTLTVFNEDIVSGQTWDMHASAKDYLATLELPDGTLLLTLVGCLGMMGVNRDGLFFGVNNLNTKKATAGVIWPALVRHCLEQKNLATMKDELEKAPVTSGHNYLLCDGQTSYHIEKAPGLFALSDKLTAKDKGLIFHTNHCLTPEGIKLQDTISINSTTHERFELMKKAQNQVKKQDDVLDLLQSHEGYPKSICSHYQSGAQDPSTTCGGGLYNHKTREFFVWRGCAHEDDNYSTRTIEISP